jgi:tryptophan synthase alpha chain
MNRIDSTFRNNLKQGKKSLILFLTAGDPDLDTTERLIPDIFDAGADLIEIGVPFSDPLADGPTIQESFTKALKKGVTLKKIFGMVSRIRKKSDKPIVLMSAYNLIYRYGIKEFANDASKAGVDGVILPDLIPEEAGSVLPTLRTKGIHPIFLAAPTSGTERLRKISKVSKGFLYYISIKGITGAKKPSVKEIRDQVTEIRRVTKLPVACGFGISTPEQAADIAKVTDGVIIGSALVKLIGKKGSKAENRKASIRFVKRIRSAINRVK